MNGYNRFEFCSQSHLSRNGNGYTYVCTSYCINHGYSATISMHSTIGTYKTTLSLPLQLPTERTMIHSKRGVIF